MDIETQLRAGLAGRAADIDAPRDGLLDDVLAGHRRAQRRRAGGLAVGLVAAVAAVAVPLAVDGADSGTPGSRGPSTSAAVEAGYVPWDVAPRGDLAGDPGYLEALVERPWSTVPEFAGPAVETRRVLYGGSVAGEVQALVIGWQDGGWQGLWLEGPSGTPASELVPTGDPTAVDPDFVTRYTGSALLLVGRPGDVVEVSARQDIAADGSIVPAPFASLADDTGVAVVDGAQLGTARIRVTRDGAVVVDTVLRGGQETREGTVDQLDLSAALAAAAGEPERDMVRLMVQSFLDQTGLGVGDVTVGVRWGGPIGNRNLAATSAVVTVRVPSGATVLLGAVGSEQTNGDTWVSVVGCGQEVVPVGIDVAALVVGMRCDLTSLRDGASLGSQLVVVPPAGTASVQLTGASGVVDTEQLSGPAFVGPAPDGVTGVTALDAAGGVLAQAPLLGMADLQLTD